MSIDKNSDVFLKACAALGADTALVAAIVHVESRWNTWAIRHEPNLPPSMEVKVGVYARLHGLTQHTERTLQHSSIGLGQCLGVTARDLGYRGPLQRLFEPQTGLEWAIRYFQKQLERYTGHVEDAVASFNAGSAKKLPSGEYVNQTYVDRWKRALNAGQRPDA